MIRNVLFENGRLKIVKDIETPSLPAPDNDHAWYEFADVPPYYLGGCV